MSSETWSTSPTFVEEKLVHENEQLRATISQLTQERDFNAGIIDGLNVAIQHKDDEIEQQAAQLEQAQTAIREARQQLRATQENWREDCLYRADDILSKALGEEVKSSPISAAEQDMIDSWHDRM